MDTEGCQIKDSEENIMVNRIHRTTKPRQALLTEAEVWHRRLGHLSNECLEIVSRNSTEMLHLTNINIICNACSEKPISKEPAEEPEAPLFQVHRDLLKPVIVISLRGAKYINRIIDAKTHHTWVYFQKSKDETAEQLDSWITCLNNNTENTVKVFFSDNGMEYTEEAMYKPQRHSYTSLNFCNFFELKPSVSPPTLLITSQQSIWRTSCFSPASMLAFWSMNLLSTQLEQLIHFWGKKTSVNRRETLDKI